MVLRRNNAVGLSSRQETGYLQPYLNVQVTFKKMGGKISKSQDRKRDSKIPSCK